MLNSSIREAAHEVFLRDLEEKYGGFAQCRSTKWEYIDNNMQVLTAIVYVSGNNQLSESIDEAREHLTGLGWPNVSVYGRRVNESHIIHLFITIDEPRADLCPGERKGPDCWPDAVVGRYAGKIPLKPQREGKAMRKFIGEKAPSHAVDGDIWIESGGPSRAVIKERVGTGWRGIGTLDIGSPFYRSFTADAIDWQTRAESEAIRAPLILGGDQIVVEREGDVTTISAPNLRIAGTPAEGKVVAVDRAGMLHYATLGLSSVNGTDRLEVELTYDADG